MSTKQIDKIKISKEKLEQEINDSWKEFLASDSDNTESPKIIFTKYIKDAFDAFVEYGKNNSSISLDQEGTTFYSFNDNMIIKVLPEAEYEKIKKKSLENNLSFNRLFYSLPIVCLLPHFLFIGYDTTKIGKCLSSDTIKKIIDAIYDKLPKIQNKENCIRYAHEQNYYYRCNSGVIDLCDPDDLYTKWAFAIEIMDNIATKELFRSFVESNLIMQEFTKNKAYNILLNFKFKEDKFILSNLEYLQNLEIDGYKFVEPFLYEDKMRADIKEYEPKMLTDVGLGLWELWEMDEGKNDGIEVNLEHSLTARDPKSSIKDGVVGIDFGTKSTVVVYQEDTVKINPMRVGIGDLGKKIEKSHYENPTIISFGDLGKFIQDYEAREGRPYTRWEDVNISHAAYNSLLQSASSEYNSYLNELKQWAGQRDKKLKIFDRKGKEFEIKGFSELEDG
ncbi:MAG: hypothetical protein KH433_06225, partial [Campylobacter concisus]|nr:hypothetical protein [Campylobacter concisus]